MCQMCLYKKWHRPVKARAEGAFHACTKQGAHLAQDGGVDHAGGRSVGGRQGACAGQRAGRCQRAHCCLCWGWRRCRLLASRRRCAAAHLELDARGEQAS